MTINPLIHFVSRSTYITIKTSLKTNVVLRKDVVMVLRKDVGGGGPRIEIQYSTVGQEFLIEQV